MKALASFVMRGPLQATAVATATAAGSAILSPLHFLTGAIVALVTLRNGWKSGAQILGGSTLIAGILLQVLFGGSGLLGEFLTITLVISVPVLAAAAVLRQTSSLGSAVGVIAILGGLMITGIYGTLGDAPEQWRAAFDRVFGEDGSRFAEPEGLVNLVGTANGLMDNTVVRFALPVIIGGIAAGLEPEAVYGSARESVGMIAGMLGLFIVTSVIVTLLLGRWLQAALYYPGGFRKDFYGLACGERLAIAALVAALGGMLLQGALGSYLRDVAYTVTAVYAFVGLAIVHHIVAVKQWGKGALTVLYLAMLLTPLSAIVLVLGWADPWLKLRSRFPLQDKNGGSRDSVS